jgi:hypothetical protein
LPENPEENSADSPPKQEENRAHEFADGGIHGPGASKQSQGAA